MHEIKAKMTVKKICLLPKRKRTKAHKRDEEKASTKNKSDNPKVAPKNIPNTKVVAIRKKSVLGFLILMDESIFLHFGENFFILYSALPFNPGFTCRPIFICIDFTSD